MGLVYVPPISEYEMKLRRGWDGVKTDRKQAWEFKHPEFQANNKDSLDNIKRKAPAPRKAANTQDDSFPAQQIDMVNTQLVATQQQLMHLQVRYDELQQGHVALMNHVSGLREVLKRHDGAMRGVLRHLGAMDQQKRARSGAFGNGIGIQDLVGNGPDDHPASPLLQVSQLLGEFSNNDSLFTKDLDQLQNGMQYRNHSEYSTPSNSNDHSGVAQTPTSAVQDNMPYAHQNSYDLDNMVYPVGQINGIDPINSEHINNIPYSFPPSGSLATQSQSVATQGGGGKLGQALAANGRVRKPVQESIWGSHTPRILLVEDDKTCARVGCKFLESFRCHVDIARHGLEAVEKMAVAGNGGSADGPAGNGPGYDLILMDIIMPHLDGISATVCIRGGGWTGPVVAMTSNIRADDIEMYFKYGTLNFTNGMEHRLITANRYERRPSQALHKRRHAPLPRKTPPALQARLRRPTTRTRASAARRTGAAAATGTGPSSASWFLRPTWTTATNNECATVYCAATEWYGADYHADGTDRTTCYGGSARSDGAERRAGHASH